MHTALIVGAGIGGLALARMLERDGWAVDVVEIAPQLRSGGQTVDLRGSSGAVVEDLGLTALCHQQLIEQRGIAWVDTDGRRLASMPVEFLGGRALVSDVELLRSDLAKILHRACENVHFRWSDTVTALTQTETEVQVEFRNAEPQSFDLVIGADGAHSRVRELSFGPEDSYRHRLGLAHAWFTMPDLGESLEGWFLVHNAPGSRVVEIRPGHAGELEAGFSFPANELPPRGDRAAQLDLLESQFADVGWRAGELLAAARAAPDFALDTFDQMKVDRWTSGRIVLLGDAAWCSSPLSGQGTALALVGAHILSGNLRQSLGPQSDGSTTMTAALSGYERDMRPEAARGQRLLPRRVQSYAPRTAMGIRASTLLSRLITLRPIDVALSALTDRARPTLLPSYPTNRFNQ